MGKDKQSVRKAISHILRKKLKKKKSRKQHSEPSSKDVLFGNLAPVCGLFVFVGMVAYRNYLLSVNSSEAAMLHQFKRHDQVYVNADGQKVIAQSRIPPKLRGIYGGSFQDEENITKSGSGALNVEEKSRTLEIHVPAKKRKQLASMQMKRRYDDRKKLLVEKCKGSSNWAWEDEMQLIAVPDKNITVCIVQKAGSTSWHKTIHELRETGDPFKKSVHTLNRYLARGLSRHVKEGLMKSPSVTRVIAVRHPFSRLISGWNNKFHKDFHMKDIFIEMVGSYLGRHPPDAEHVIAFEDFAQFIADNGLEHVDVHFKSIEQLCKPCSFPYDYIVRAETALNDLWYVLDRINATMESFVKHSIEPTGDGTDDSSESPWAKETETIKYFFQRVPRKTVETLLELYQDDFEKFGYTFDMDTFMVGDIID